MPNESPLSQTVPAIPHDNQFPYIPSGLQVTDTLPPEVDFVGWAPEGEPPGASEADDEVHWSGMLAAGEDVTLVFLARHVGEFSDLVAA